MNVLGLFDGIHIFGDIFKTLSTSESYEEDAFLDESEEDETIFTLANELCELVAEDGETCCSDALK